jgi:hypothetical protein
LVVKSQRNAVHCGDQTAFVKVMKDGFTIEKSDQPPDMPSDPRRMAQYSATSPF